MPKTDTPRRLARWIVAGLLAGLLATAAREAIRDGTAPTEEREIARRARQASWIVARQRERARERSGATPPAPGARLAEGGWGPAVHGVRIGSR
jgi:hypothetical protein